MLDYVKSSMGHEDYEAEGVFEQDPDVQAEWQEPVSQEYGGEFRYINLGPAKVAKMMESIGSMADPGEREALQVAHRYWGMKKGYSAKPEDLGWVHRGEPREAVRAASMRELASGGNRVSHVSVMGSLRKSGPPGGSSGGEPGELLGIIDFDWLTQEMPAEPMDEIGLMLVHDVDEVAAGF
jgi:hypothetical protein